MAGWKRDTLQPYYHVPDEWFRDRDTDKVMNYVKDTQHTYLDTFFSMDDAYKWLENLKKDYPEEEWEIIEERINLLGGGYRTGISFKRRQKEFDFGE